MEYLDISILRGKTLVEINQGDDEIVFTCDDDTKYRMFHQQDCCESVYVESVDGNIMDLIGSPIVLAEEVSNNELFNGKPEPADSFTWTFYKLATLDTFVTIRWLGESNGYYSESVDIVELGKDSTEDEW